MSVTANVLTFVLVHLGTLVVLANSSISADPLLDEYVAHVDRVNRRFAPVTSSQHQRHKRGVLDDLLDDIEWTHREVLDRTGRVVLRWQIRHQEILFRVEARTRGYVGIGFSPNGGMQGADIVMGWVNDYTGKTILLDCHGSTQSKGSIPIRDEIDNYTLIRGIQNDTHTILEFRRALDTCDQDDYILNADTVRIIWAINDVDPHYDFDLSYHGELRGTQNVHLLGPPAVHAPRETDLQHWDVTLNSFEVRSDTNTLYWCKIFKSPSFPNNENRHITGYEPVIGTNHSTLLHHILLHECELPEFDPKTEDGRKRSMLWNRYSGDLGQACYSEEMPREWDSCVTPLIAWAIGSKGENLPEHVGLPLKANKYYMMEVHFDNADMKKSVATSGLRLKYTNQKRRHEAGILVTGVALSSLHVIPPKQKEYKSAGLCSVGCTEKALPKSGINIISVLMHSHLAGRKIRLRHIRGDKELPPIARDDHYNFNYQQSRTLSTEAKLLPGDALVTECTYSTRGRNRPTLGGYSTRDEMCLAFVMHYPRTELSGCYSMPPVRYFFGAYGVREFYGRAMNEVETAIILGGMATPTPRTPLFPYNPGDEHSPEANAKAILALRNAKEYTIVSDGIPMDGDSEFMSYSASRSLLDELVIQEPVEFRNRTFMRHLADMPYDASVTERIEEYFYRGLHQTFCRRRNDTTVEKEKIEKFPTFEAYEDPNKPVIECNYRSRSGGDTPKKIVQLILGVVCAVLYLFSRY